MTYLAILLYIAGVRMHYVLASNVVDLVDDRIKCPTGVRIFASLLWPLVVFHYTIIDYK